MIVLQAGVIAKLLQNRTDGGISYETASDFSAGTRGFDMGSYALVRFSPQASMAEITNSSTIKVPRSWTAPARADQTVCIG